MNDAQDVVFRKLFMQACHKCFGHAPAGPLGETEARALSNNILESTGLLLGVKSLKNYSIYFFDPIARKENPSVATLDTLARYVLDAPPTNEIARKNDEPHHPYWFRYKASWVQQASTEGHWPMEKAVADEPSSGPSAAKRSNRYVAYILVATVALAAAIFLIRNNHGMNRSFTDDFSHVSDDSLRAFGWTILRPDTVFWEKRAINPGVLTLYTLPGDNWPGKDTIAPIRNLLVRKIEGDCFTAEVHFKDLRLAHNWQQVGLILGEEPGFQSRVVRISLSYNDFFGGYSKEPEIIIQGLSSVKSSQFSKPEEFAHLPILTLNSGTDSLVWTNLKNAALKVEKNGNSFRFLFGIGSADVFAFKEAVHVDYPFNPKYIGLFAIQGLSVRPHIGPVYADQFQITHVHCDGSSH